MVCDIMKKALITGVTGQDGSYLAEFLLDKGYEVHVASNGDEKIEYCDKHFNLPFERSPFKKNNLKAYKKLKEIINPKAILRWDADKKFGCNQTVLERAYAGQHANYPLTWVVDDDRNADTVELFKNLLTDKKTYDEFKDQDNILPSASKQIIKMLSDLEKHFERLIYS